jgi:hypothetical protein
MSDDGDLIFSDIDDIDAIDLLDMLSDDDMDVLHSQSPNDRVLNEPDNKDATTGTPGIKSNVKSIIDMIGNSGNPGSGDVTQDLLSWFNGNDKLPSDPLAEYLSNASLKAEFGMFFNMIANFSRMKRLQEFVDKAEDAYFNPDDILNFDPDELRTRLLAASNVMKDLYEMNRRTISSMKSKTKESEMDKLKILLSAIPNNKLKEIITNLNNG